MSLTGKFFKSLFLRGFSASSSFLLSIVVARQLPMEEAGFFFLGLVIVTALSQLAPFGMHTASLKFIGVAAGDQEWTKVRGYIRQTIIWPLLFSFCIGGGIFIFRGIIAIRILKKEVMEEVLFFMAPSIVLVCIAFILSYHLQALGKLTRSNFMLSFGTPSLLIVMNILFEVDNAVRMGQYYFVATMITLIMGFIFIYSSIPNGRSEQINNKELFLCSVPLGVMNTMTVLTLWSSQFLSGIWISSEEIAKLAVAQRMSGLISFILLSVNMIVAPIFANLYKRQKYDALFDTFSWSLKFSFLLAVPLSFIILFFPDFIMGIFGEEFKKAGLLLIILSGGQIVNVLSGSVGLLLTMTGHEKDMRNVVLVSGLSTLILAIILTPYLGAIGAAFSTAVGMILQNVICIFFVKKRLDISLWKAFFTVPKAIV